MTNHYIMHFPGEEAFIRRLMGLKKQLDIRGGYVSIGFCSPYQQTIVEAMFQPTYDVYFDGGYIDAERKMVQIGERKPLITILELTYHKKFGSIRHQDVLGALLGLGIDRDLIGDIVVGDRVFVVVLERIVMFLLQELKQVGRVHVQVHVVDDIVYEKSSGEIKTILVSSYRLDKLVSEVCRLKRPESQVCIEHGDVKVNHRVITDVSHLLVVGDLVAVRRFGRFKILSVDGYTKKERIVLTIEKM